MADTQIEEPKDIASPFLDPMDAGLPGEPKISDADKEAFFKCFISDNPYTEEYSLFGGKLRVKFTTQTVPQNNDVLKQIGIDRQRGVVEKNDSYFVYILQYRLGISILTINDVPFQEHITPEKFPLNLETGDFYIKERSKVFDKWPSFKLVAFTDVFNQFEQKYNRLTREVQNETFWKAGE